MSLTQELQRNPNRPLSIALAQRLANTKPGDPLMAAYNRIFQRMSPVDQLRCRDELHWCQLAKRGQLLAEVS